MLKNYNFSEKLKATNLADFYRLYKFVKPMENIEDKVEIKKDKFIDALQNNLLLDKNYDELALLYQQSSGIQKFEIISKILSLADTDAFSAIKDLITQDDLNMVKLDLDDHDEQALINPQNYGKILKELITIKSEYSTNIFSALAKFFNFEELKEILAPKIFLHYQGYYFNDEYSPFHRPFLLQLDELTPIQNTIDILLSRTGGGLGQEKARELYQDIMNLDPMAKEMMIYTALLIVQGDNIQFSFNNHIGTSKSLYHPSSNSVIIGIKDYEATASISHQFSMSITLKSFFIHELGHYFYNKVFTGGVALPFNFQDVFNKLKASSKSELNEAAMDNYINYNIFENKIFNSLEKDDLKSTDFIQYKEAALAPVAKVASLLNIDISDIVEKYSYPIEYNKYLIDNYIIHLFLFNQIYGNYPEEISAYDYGMFKTIFDVYNQFFVGECTIPIMEDLSNIETKVMQELYPAILKEFKLTDNQIIFISRIADYMKRSYEYKNLDQDPIRNNQNAELIVRFLEFKALGLDQDLIDSFAGLVEYYQKVVSPIIKVEMLTHQQDCLEYMIKAEGKPVIVWSQPFFVSELCNQREMLDNLQYALDTDIDGEIKEITGDCQGEIYD